METSKNERAKQIMGMRDLKGAIPVDQPCELGFHCPVCEYAHEVDGKYDERLQWSEYNGMVWCIVCDVDYPSPFCQLDIKKAIDLFLDCVEHK